MSRPRSRFKTTRIIQAAFVSFVAIFTVFAIWSYLNARSIPKDIRIASGVRDGMYHSEVSNLSAIIGRQTGKRVTNIESSGSSHNLEMLESEECHLALLQSGTDTFDEIKILVPMYFEPVFLVARNGSGIEEISDLAGKVLAMGPEKSGTLDTAQQILKHYDLPLNSPDEPAGEGVTGVQRYFTELEEDPEIDAAVVITGLLNEQLKDLLSTRDYSLLPLESGAAFCTRHHGFQPLVIPSGQFGPGIPAFPTESVTTTAVLACHPNVSPKLIRETIEAIYELDFRRSNPSLITAQDALEWDLYPLHPESRRYLDPATGMGNLATKMETLAATKELFFALVAILFLAYQRWGHLKEREQKVQIQELKDQLDCLLNETVTLERAQMNETSPEVLEQYLDEITQIKLKALDELADEKLRGDRTFQIFLTQCANLIAKIQSKIELEMIKGGRSNRRRGE